MSVVPCSLKLLLQFSFTKNDTITYDYILGVAVKKVNKNGCKFMHNVESQKPFSIHQLKFGAQLKQATEIDLKSIELYSYNRVDVRRSP
jgi:hypothetical protein